MSDTEESGSGSEGEGAEKRKGPEPVSGGGSGGAGGASKAPAFDDALPVPRGLFRITKRIYIGASRATFEALAAGDAEKYGITHVLNVGAREEPTPEEVRLAYDTTDVLLLDDPTARLSPALKIALPAINKAIKDGGRIVVCCRGGESRSPAIVIAYLIQAKKAPYDSVYADVEAACPGVDLNEGFEEQLQLLAGGASAQALVDAADRRDTGEKRRVKAKETERSRAKDRDRKGRGRFDD